MELSICSDIGKVRTNNEDSFLAVPPWCEPALSVGRSLFAVADGMGGHNGGEVASALAMRALERWLPTCPAGDLAGSLLENAFSEANGAVWEHARTHPELTGMGTTLTVLLVNGKRALVGHVGDSRAYLLRKGALRQLTNDHTLVAEQVRQGRLTPEEAHTHPARHILSRALGVREFINVDTQTLDLEERDVIMLCSDGVYGPIPDQRLQEQLGKTPFRGVGAAIIGDALEAGGPDNTTLVAVFFDELPVQVPGRFSFQRLKKLVSYWGSSLGR